MVNEKNILTINFLVNNQIIKRIDKNFVVADSVNYLKATFKFTEDWKNTKKQVYLQNYDGYCGLYDLPESNILMIPSDYIKSKGFKIAIKGVVDDTVIKTNNIDVYNEPTQITTNDLIIPVIETVNFGEGEKEWILSSTLSLYRNGEIYTIDIPETIVDYTSEDDVIHIKKLDNTDLTDIKLPHKESIERLEEWTQQSLEGVDEALNELNDRLSKELNLETQNRKDEDTFIRKDLEALNQDLLKEMSDRLNADIENLNKAKTYTNDQLTALAMTELKPNADETLSSIKQTRGQVTVEKQSIKIKQDQIVDMSTDEEIEDMLNELFGK